MGGCTDRVVGVDDVAQPPPLQLGALGPCQHGQTNHPYEWGQHGGLGDDRLFIEGA